MGSDWRSERAAEQGADVAVRFVDGSGAALLQPRTRLDTNPPAGQLEYQDHRVRNERQSDAQAKHPQEKVVVHGFSICHGGGEKFDPSPQQPDGGDLFRHRQTIRMRMVNRVSLLPLTSATIRPIIDMAA